MGVRQGMRAFLIVVIDAETQFRIFAEARAVIRVEKFTDRLHCAERRAVLRADLYSEKMAQIQMALLMQASMKYLMQIAVQMHMQIFVQKSVQNICRTGSHEDKMIHQCYL